MKDIFWIQSDPPVPLAIVMKPRPGDWLEDDLIRMKRDGIHTLVSLLEAEEADMLGLDEEGPLAKKIGMQFLSHPIPDVHVPPDLRSFQSFVEGLAARLLAGDQIGVHCRGSIGRATVTAAATLIQLGWTPKDALAAIQTARGCVVPDTQEQEDWILNYKAQA